MTKDESFAWVVGEVQKIMSNLDITHCPWCGIDLKAPHRKGCPYSEAKTFVEVKPEKTCPCESSCWFERRQKAILGFKEEYVRRAKILKEKFNDIPCESMMQFLERRMREGGWR